MSDEADQSNESLPGWPTGPMPLTAEWTATVRKRFGKKYVNSVINRAMKGERNCFYAVEAGHFAGTPFDFEPDQQMLVSMSILTGQPFVAGIREPKGEVNFVIGAKGASNGAD